MEQTKKAHAVFSFLSSCRHRFYPFRLIILRQGWPYKRFNLEKITLPLAFKPSLSLKRVFLTPFFSYKNVKKCLYLSSSEGFC
jgi:hypothetical protein